MIRASAFDLWIMAKTIYGEARGETKQGKYAVACVIRNRWKSGKWGETVAEVCLKPWQFSCWNKNDPNYRMISNDDFDPLTQAFKECFEEAWYALIHMQQDVTNNSMHYHVKKMSRKPKWASGKEPICEVGNHVFYNDID